jgi:large subunit ribosomal protein L24
MKARFKPKYNIKKGDLVIVISGAARPRKDDSGKMVYKPKAVKQVLLSDNGAKVIVEGVNLVTKHSKPSAQNTKGGIIKKEAPIHISNVMLWDATAKAPSKVKRMREDGKSVRILKKSGNKL